MRPKSVSPLIGTSIKLDAETLEALNFWATFDSTNVSALARQQLRRAIRKAVLSQEIPFPETCVRAFGPHATK